MRNVDYSGYTPEDFAQDESFQTFTFDPASAQAQWWQRWLAQHPHKAPDCHAAQELLRLLTPQQRPVAAELKQQELRKLLQAIRPQPRPQPTPRLMGYRRAALRLAAVVAVVLAAALGWLQWRASTSPLAAAQYATGYGQQRQLTLPDGSMVVLNANSSLRTSDWSGNPAREVWLTGEAYFHVARKAPAHEHNIAQAAAPAKFVVHAGTLDVTVLGTQFNVTNRGGQSKVVLNSGKVQVDVRGGKQPTRVLMRPGELVEVSPAQQLRKRAVDAALYSSWTDGRLSFDHQPVAEVVKVLEDSYGLQVEVTDTTLLSQKVTGSLPSANVDELLDALSKTLDVRVSRAGRRVRLEPAP